MSLINNGMDIGDMMLLIDESYDDENTSDWDEAITESDERIGVPVEIDDDIVEDEYEDLFSNDDVTNPAGEPSIILRAALDDSEYPEVEDEVMDIMSDDEDDDMLTESDYEEYDVEIDQDIEDIIEDDEFYEDI